MSYTLSLLPPIGTFAALATASVFSMKTSPNGGLWTINDPTAVYDSVANRVYVGYVTSANDVTILAWNPTTSAVTSTVTLDTNVAAEIHAAPCVLVRDDGYILVAWAMHDGTTISMARSTNPNDASAFNAPTTITASSLDTWPDITYIYLHQLSSESDRIHMFWREVHASANYGRLAHTYSDDGGTTWALRDLIVVAQDSTEVVYWKSISDGSKIHLFHTDTDREDASPSSLFHRYYDAADGDWHTSDGTVVSSTIPSASTLVHDASLGPITPTGAGIESDGTPYVAFHIVKSGTTADHYVARYRSGAWQNDFVVNNGGLASGHRTLGHIAVNRSNPDRALSLVKVGSFFEAFLYTSGDDGATWSGDQLTSGGSSHALCAQAVFDAPPGLEFIWARGTWTTDSNFTVGMEGYGFLP